MLDILYYCSSGVAPEIDLPSLLVTSLGLLPGQNLTGRCLSLDTSAQVGLDDSQEVRYIVPAHPGDPPYHSGWSGRGGSQGSKHYQRCGGSGGVSGGEWGEEGQYESESVRVSGEWGEEGQYESERV